MGCVIGFTGTRDGLTTAQRRRLGEFMDARSGSGSGVTLHHGDCVGADLAAHFAARERGWRVEVHPGLGPTALRAFVSGYAALYPAKPNLERNADIVRQCDELWACPSTDREQLRSGTWATVRLARRMNKPLYIIRPNGDIGYEPAFPAESGDGVRAISEQRNPAPDDQLSNTNNILREEWNRNPSRNQTFVDGQEPPPLGSADQ